jgi:hypothetical protein
MESSKEIEFTYDVALSFAGEDRPYVAQVAAGLAAEHVKVFYDEYEPATLWGKDLYTHLRDIYQTQARYTILFASKHYAEKVWTNHERESAQSRAISERTEYILPARFDDSTIPGLLPTTGYIDLRTTTPEQLVGLFLAKLGRKHPSWVPNASPSLPGEPTHRGESIRELSARLAADARKRESREEILGSERGVALATAEVQRLHEYIAAEVDALRSADKNLDVSYQVSRERVFLVRSPQASFTMHWGQQHGNKLKGSSLFTQQFDGPYSLDSSRSREPEEKTHFQFDLDSAGQPGWNMSDVAEGFLRTQQLGDRFLSRVIRRNYEGGAADNHDFGFT